MHIKFQFFSKNEFFVLFLSVTLWHVNNTFDFICCCCIQTLLVCLLLYVSFYWIIQIPFFVSYLIFFTAYTCFTSVFDVILKKKTNQRSCSWFIGCVSHSSWCDDFDDYHHHHHDGHLWHSIPHDTVYGCLFFFQINSRVLQRLKI